MIISNNAGFYIEKNFGQRKEYMNKISNTLSDFREELYGELFESMKNRLYDDVGEQALSPFQTKSMLVIINAILSGKEASIKSSLILIDKYFSTVEDVVKTRAKPIDYSAYDYYIKKEYKDVISCLITTSEFSYELKQKKFKPKETIPLQEAILKLFYILRKLFPAFESSLTRIGVDSLMDLNFNSNIDEFIGLDEAYEENKLKKTRRLKIELIPDILEKRSEEADDLFGDGCIAFVLTYLESLYYSSVLLFKNPIEKNESQDFFDDLFKFLKDNTKFFIDKLDSDENFDYFLTYKNFYNFDFEKKLNEVREELKDISING